MTVEQRPPQPEPAPVTPLGDRALVPDVVGLGLVDAHRLARQHGLRLTVSVWETKIGPWGMVLSQQPHHGAATPRGTHVHVVAAGRPYLVVPDVGGLDAGAALHELRRSGLLPELVEDRASRTLAPGQVIATRPRAGTLVPDGALVVVLVARAPRGPARRRP